MQITKGNLLGAGMHGTTPSGTSDYYSVDVGLLHIAALSTIPPSGAELAWLNKDLAAANANRAKVRAAPMGGGQLHASRWPWCP